MKKLPQGISTFSKLIKNNYIYVDKTKYIYDMINEGEVYFLSRPRRFGKSLLVSTLEELFKGNKELFKGLFIYDLWNWNHDYPVIKLDFTKIGHKNPQVLETSLDDFINQKARDFSVNLISNTLTTKFAELIEQIHRKTGKEVVILIDEYDKPINNHLDDIELAKKNRDVLRNFYQVLKGNDENLRFLFITGITKFSKTSIFSDLNNLTDITIQEKYAKICGYTQNNLESYFKEYLLELSESTEMEYEDLLLAIKKYYNGYSWDGKNFLYNPFSILKLFYTKKFANYWAETGTPKLLVDLLKTTNVDLDILIKKEYEFKGTFPNFELENLDFHTVLLQTGYLTIKNEILRPPNSSLYIIGIPNKEVEESLFSYILGFYTNFSAESIEPMTKKMLTYIYKQDEAKLQKSLETLLHKIPNLIYGEFKNEIEAYYKVLVISWLQLLGFDIESEIMTLEGRLDALVKHKDLALILEFKYDDKKSFQTMLNEAENQIIKRGYYKPYQNMNISILTVAFKSREVKCKFKLLNELLKEYKNRK